MEKDILYKALTRPALVMGLPLQLLILIIWLTIMLCMFISFYFIGVGIFTYIICVVFNKKDFKNSYVERFLLSYEKKHDNVYIDFDYNSFNNLKNDVTVYQPHKTSIDIVSKLTNLTKTSNKKITYFSKSFNIQQ